MKIAFKEFMEDVKLNLEKMDEAEKTKFIYEMARLAKEYERKDFLDRFKTEVKKDRTKEIEEVERLCDKLEEGELIFSAAGHEEYGYSWGDSEWVYEYSDYQGIGKKLEEAFLLAENLLYEKSYEEAFDLYHLLFYTNLLAYDEDSGEMFDIGLEEAVQEGLVDIDIKDLCHHILYAAYQKASGEDRVKAVYNCFHNGIYKEITLDGMMSVGPEELEGIEEFMYGFSELLKGKSGDLESRLLREASLYLNVDAIEVARQSANVHPGLYRDLCSEAYEKCDYDKAISIGMDCLENVDKDLVVRSKTSIIAAMAARKIGDMEKLRVCIREAFISESTPVNFLNLFTVFEPEEIKKIYCHVDKLPVFNQVNIDFKKQELEQNQLNPFTKSALKLLSGDFKYAKAECMRDKEYLGWSGSFKGLCVPLVLLLLDQDDDDTIAREKILTSIMDKIGSVFSKYVLEDFYQLLGVWKSKMSIDESDEYLQWMEKEVHARVEAVVGGKYRKSYYKAAELIVYLGQVLESQGKTNAEYLMVEKYRKMHSRKRAFIAELKELR